MLSKGWVELVVGPMFAGKTTHLTWRVKRDTIGGKKCFSINSVKDDRYSEEGVLMSHDLVSSGAVKCSDLSELDEEKLSASDVILVDEGGFFPGIAKFADYWANRGKVVIVAALSGNFKRGPFDEVSLLYPIAEKITFLTAVCPSCGGDAAFSKRLGDETELVLIGGTEKYVASCRECFFKK